MTDIRDKDDVKVFVDAFYTAAREDHLLGPVFNNRIKNEDWPKHLERIYGFWNTILFGISDYRGNPFSHHLGLDIDKQHFDRWVELFQSVVNSNFKGVKADEALLRAGKMKELFESKLKYIADNPNQFPIM